MNLTQSGLLLTREEFLLEKRRLGSRFKRENYVRLDTQLSEGGSPLAIAAGTFLSLPMVFKLVRTGVERLQECFRDIPKGRTLHNIFDEDSQEDMIITKLEELGVKDPPALYKLTKAIYKGSHEASHKLDTLSGVERTHQKKDKDIVKSRLARHKSDPRLMAFLDFLGAIQHGLHHTYQSFCDLIASTLIAFFETQSGAKLTPLLRNHIVDLLGNVLFFVAVFFLLTGFKAAIPDLNFWNTIKACELICESLEMLAIGGTIVSSFKGVIDKLRIFLKDIDIEEVIDGIATKTARKLKSLGQAMLEPDKATNTSRFAPEVLSQKKPIKKDAYAGTDYYGYPTASNESLIIDYIKLLIS